MQFFQNVKLQDALLVIINVFQSINLKKKSYLLQTCHQLEVLTIRPSCSIMSTWPPKHTRVAFIFQHSLHPSVFTLLGTQAGAAPPWPANPQQPGDSNCSGNKPPRYGHPSRQPDPPSPCCTAKGDDNMTPTCGSKYVTWCLQWLPGAHTPSETDSKNKRVHHFTCSL